MTAQESIRRLFATEVPAEELRHMNEKCSLGLKQGATFLDALAARTAQMAAESETWAEAVQQFGGMRGGGDG